MAYYLQMDGVDDYIKPPQTVALAYDRIVFDVLITGTAAAHQYVIGASSNIFRINAGTSNLFLSGVSQTGFALGSRVTIAATFTNGVKSNYNMGLFAQADGTLPTKGNIYDIKLYNGATLVAHYDMTLGNVQDQSGNGYHATLNGGTWVQDAGSGTPGAVSYATKQIINQSGSAATATKQVINQSSSIGYATKQILNQPGSFNAATKQSLYSVSSVTYATQQLITSGGITGAISYATRQAIYLAGTADFKTKQSLFSTSSADFKTMQAMYAAGALPLSSKQSIYRPGVDPAATRQTIVRYVAEVIPVRLAIYEEGFTTWATSQVIFDQQRLILSRVPLLADRSLRISLLGSRELRIELRGDVSAMKKNQNFEMETGESKYLDFTATDNGKILDLTGATIKWVMKKSYLGEWSLQKDTVSGIEITDAANGNFTVMLLSDDTENFPAGVYYHEVYLIDVSNHRSPISSGIITLTPSSI